MSDETTNKYPADVWSMTLNEVTQHIEIADEKARVANEKLKAAEEQLKAAKAAGIPVLVAHLLPEGSALPPNVDALMPVPFHEAATGARAAAACPRRTAGFR